MISIYISFVAVFRGFKNATHLIKASPLSFFKALLKNLLLVVSRLGVHGLLSSRPLLMPIKCALHHVIAQAVSGLRLVAETAVQSEVTLY
jgi:hypothetical protein